MTTTFVLGFLLLTLLVLYFRPHIVVWTIVALLYLIATYLICINSISMSVFTVFSIIYLVISIVFNIRPLRAIISRPIYFIAKKVIPSISETEKLALDAGDPWYEKEVFSGMPDFKKLHNIKKFSLTKEEQDFLDNETTELCDMIDEWKVTHIDRDMPVEVWNFFREKLFFGLVIKKEYGGKGFSAAAHSEIVLKIATRTVSGAVTVMVPNSLGPGELLYHYGTKEQKDYYLPRLAKGIDIPCFALTGPTAGSDATSIPDKGTVCYGEYNGNQVLGIKLTNVDKRYITLAPIATLVGLAFKLEDPDNLLAGVGKVGITCALLPYDHPGLEIGNRLYPLSQVFMNGVVRIKEAFIPMDWVIGGQAMTGEGWRMLVECLSIGRSISLPACGTANALMSTVTTSAYSVIREQFKVSIGNFEGVEDQLAKMGGLTYMMNATRQFTVGSVDVGIKPAVASAISKYHLTENGRTVLNSAMDIHAGRAIIMGPNNYLARAYQGAPVSITVEGSNIMTRNLLIYGQGMMQCHPYLRTIYESLMGDKGFKNFDNAMFGFVGYAIQTKLRAIFHSFTCGAFANGYSPSKFNKYYKRITRLSSAFAFVSNSAIIFIGGNLKLKERISARLGDTMSYLYMACATLKYFEDNGERKSDEIFVQWVLEHCLFNSQTALSEVMDNFGVSYVGCILKSLVFPYGKPYKKPSDKLEKEISHNLQSDSDTRLAFKAMCHIPNRNDDLIGRVEIAFQEVLQTTPIKEKIYKAIKAKELPKASVHKLASKALELGIITSAELQLLTTTAKHVNDVIQVDEFGPYELGPKNAHPEWQHI